MVYSLRDKLHLIYKATRTHARNLATFAVIYKFSLICLRRTSPTGKERPFDTFLAGLIGGYTVFGRGIQSSVNQQIVIYVFARVILALAKLTVERRSQGEPGVGRELKEKLKGNAWPVFASFSWAAVMWIFRWHPATIQPSLRSSMQYMYVTEPFPRTSEDEVTVSCTFLNQRPREPFPLYPTDTDARHLDTWIQTTGTAFEIS